MSQSNQKIDTHSVIATINENLKAIRENFDPSLLSDEAKKEILQEFTHLEELALKVKAQFKEA